MNNNYMSSIRNRYKDLSRLGLLMLAFLSISVFSFGQFSVTTSPPLNGGNGSAGVSFNVTANNAITITDFANTFYGSGTGTYEIWYNTSAISGAPSITTANGWIQLATGTATASGAGLTGNSPIALNSSVSLQMNAGETYGFFIFGTGVNTNYTSWAAANQTSFTDANIEVFTGPNVSYGGSFPNPTFHPRQFNGTVYYSLTSQAPDDAGITEIVSPSFYCDGDTQALIVNVQNFGTEQLDSCQITWEINGTPTTQWFVLNLDTFGGIGALDTTLTLASIPMNGNVNISVFTSLPNNMADTVNANDTALYSGGPSLNGTYSLGSSASADFASFTEFVDSLYFVGVCGPVIVNVENGTYAETILLTEVSSMSAINSVTFKGNATNNALTKLTSASGTTVIMDGGDHFSFEDLTIENTNGNNYVVQFNGGSDYNRFENCYFRNNDSTSTSTLDCLVYSGSQQDNYNTFKGNTFKNGSYGLYWYGTGTTALEEGNVFLENTFLDQYFYGARIYYQFNILFEKNTITSSATYTSGYGVFAYYCANSKFVRNHIYSELDSPWPLYGMYLGYNNATSFNNPNVIANNVISIGDTNNTFSTYYGMYLVYNDLNNFVHNTSIVRGGSTNARAIYTGYNDFGRFINNIAVNTAIGYSLYDQSSQHLISDNNVYYSNGSTLMYNESPFATLAAWQSNSTEDEHSLQINPSFNNILTGTFCNDTLDNIGVPVATTTNDFSGFMRSASMPDPGAHEFFGLSGINLGPDTTLCQGTFELSVGDSNLVNAVTWTVGSTTFNTPTYVVTANNGAQTFAISAGVSTNCGSASDNVNITLVPQANLADSVHICAGESVVLSASGGPTASVTWFPSNETTNNITVSSPGFVSVTKIEEGCESTSSSIITQSEGVGVLDIEPCDADLPASVSVAINNGVSYSWSGGSAPSNATNTFDASGAYAVTATDAFGCVSTDSFSVDVIDVPNTVISETHAGTFYYFSSANSSDVGSDASYLWQFGDGGTSTLPNPTYNYNWGNPSSPPQYTVSLSITNNCGTDTDNETFIINVLGIEATANTIGFKVYPNPSDDFWNVSFDQTMDEVTVEVLDITGRIVFNESQNSTGLFQVDLSNLSNGNYVLKVIANSEISYAKVTVAK